MSEPDESDQFQGVEGIPPVFGLPRASRRASSDYDGASPGPVPGSERDFREPAELQLPGIRFPASLVSNFSDVQDGRFLLGYVSEGSGVLRIGDVKIALSAPSALMLTDREAGAASFGRSFVMTAVSFMPAFIDSSFRTTVPLGRAPELGLAERFEADALRPFIRPPRPETGILRLTPPETPVLARSFRELSDISLNPRVRYAPCRFRSCLLSMIHYLGYRTVDAVPVYDDSPLAPVLLHLQSNYTRAVTLDELCSVFATNRTTLSRQFRKETGMSVGEYLTMLRIRLAESLLGKTSLPVAEVAERCGYRDATHFGRMFRERTGKTPGSWRQARG